MAPSAISHGVAKAAGATAPILFGGCNMRVTAEMREAVKAAVGAEKYKSTSTQLKALSRDARNRRRRERNAEGKPHWRSRISRK